VARKFDPRKDKYAPEIFSFIKKTKPDLLPWLGLAALIGTIRYWLIWCLPGFIKKWLAKYGYFVDSLKQEHAFDNPEIIDVIHTMALSMKDSEQ
jgi:hypothetical protein